MAASINGLLPYFEHIKLQEIPAWLPEELLADPELESSLYLWLASGVLLLLAMIEWGGRCIELTKPFTRRWLHTKLE